MGATINESGLSVFESPEARSLALKTSLTALVDKGFTPKEIQEAAAAMEATPHAPSESAKAAEVPDESAVTAVSATLQAEVNNAEKKRLTQRVLGENVPGSPYVYSDSSWTRDNLLSFLSFELQGREDAIVALERVLRATRPAIIPALTVLSREIKENVGALTKLPDDDTWKKMEEEIARSPKYLALINILARIKSLGTMIKDPEKKDWPRNFALMKTKEPLEKELNQKIKELGEVQSDFVNWVTQKSLVGKFLPPGVQVDALTDYTVDGDVHTLESNLLKNLRAKLNSINEPFLKLAQSMLAHHKRLSAELSEAEEKGVVVGQDQRALITLPENIDAILGLAS